MESSWLRQDSKDSQMMVPVKDGWEALEFGDSVEYKNLFKPYQDYGHLK